MKQTLKVWGFKHHNQPYGTDHINGTWYKYDVTDVARYKEKIQLALADEKDYWRENKARNLRDALAMLERRMAKGMGVLVGTVTKGSTTSRMFQHSTSTDNAGKSVRLETVTARDIEKGHLVSVAG